MYRHTAHIDLTVQPYAITLPKSTAFTFISLMDTDDSLSGDGEHDDHVPNPDNVAEQNDDIPDAEQNDHISLDEESDSTHHEESEVTSDNVPNRQQNEDPDDGDVEILNDEGHAVRNDLGNGPPPLELDSDSNADSDSDVESNQRDENYDFDDTDDSEYNQEIEKEYDSNSSAEESGEDVDRNVKNRDDRPQQNLEAEAGPGRIRKSSDASTQISRDKYNYGVCPVCLKKLGKKSCSVTKCGHIHCTKCVRTFLETYKDNKKCPTCRRPLKSRHPFFNIYLQPSF